jgi:hypothetical protein
VLDGNAAQHFTKFRIVAEDQFGRVHIGPVEAIDVSEAGNNGWFAEVEIDERVDAFAVRGIPRAGLSSTMCSTLSTALGHGVAQAATRGAGSRSRGVKRFSTPDNEPDGPSTAFVSMD